MKKVLMSDEEVVSYLKSIGIDENEYRCKDCGGLIKWRNTEFNLSVKNLNTEERSYKDLVIRGVSFANKRTYNNHTYHLSYCYDCACKRFPDIPNKKFALQPASFISKDLFCISDDDFDSIVTQVSKRTKEIYIEKFGEEEGLKRWESYCSKQSVKNTFEFKKQKYGWSKEQFDRFNESRACTLKNFIKRHGEEEGLKRWESYCQRQRETTKKEYFIKEYGLEEGTKKYEAFSKARALSVNGKEYSKIANEMFDRILPIFKDHKVWSNCTELGEYLIGNRYLIDFYDQTINIAIEFYGDYWHANPKTYQDDDQIRESTAKAVREHDRERIEFIENRLGTKVFIVWESDYRRDKEQCLRDLCMRIHSYLLKQIDNDSIEHT